MPDRDDLTPLESRLAALRPAPGRLDRDRMFFDAGRASARAEARARAWAFSAVASALAAVGLGIGLARERSRALGLERALASARGIAPATPSPPPATTPPVEVASSSYLALSHRALAGLGLDDPPVDEPRRPGGPGPHDPGRPLSPRGLRDL